MDYSPWGHKESDMTEQLTLSLFISSRGETQNRIVGGTNQCRNGVKDPLEVPEVRCD